MGIPQKQKQYLLSAQSTHPGPLPGVGLETLDFLLRKIIIYQKLIPNFLSNEI